MGEYEPEDSRVVTQSTHTAPGEPPRTGPREDAARRQAEQDEGRAQTIDTARAEQGNPLGEAPDPARLRGDADRPLGDG